MKEQTSKNPNDLEIMLMHSKQSDKGTRITVAGIYNQEKATMSLGVAKCFRGDNFCKKTGRELAVGRLDLVANKPMLVVPVEPEADIQEVFKNKFNQIEAFLQWKGLKSLVLPSTEGGLDNRPGAEKAYKAVKLPALTDSEIY